MNFISFDLYARLSDSTPSGVVKTIDSSTPDVTGDIGIKCLRHLFFLVSLRIDCQMGFSRVLDCKLLIFIIHKHNILYRRFSNSQFGTTIRDKGYWLSIFI